MAQLLRSELDFPPDDIIFDCLITLLGSHGIRASPKDFIDAVAEVRRTCPGVSCVAGDVGKALASLVASCRPVGRRPGGQWPAAQRCMLRMQGSRPEACARGHEPCGRRQHLSRPCYLQPVLEGKV
ncbi:metH [Symbiodinium necroappetens]|uniref:MetH protein n=1 Tax=Symbiodinium necroappetens TaxID=1628268 RepID=A0A813C8J2_9DINO|nr:metH [Symbiodinium necroappetens]